MPEIVILHKNEKYGDIIINGIFSPSNGYMLFRIFIIADAVFIFRYMPMTMHTFSNMFFRRYLIKFIENLDINWMIENSLKNRGKMPVSPGIMQGGIIFVNNNIDTRS